MRHLGMPVRDAAARGDASPLSRDGKGASATRLGTTAMRDNKGLLLGPFGIIWHDSSSAVMDGKGRHERNGDEPQAQQPWMAMDGTMTTQR